MKIPKAVPKVLLILSTIVVIPSLIISPLYVTFGIQVMKNPLLWKVQPEPSLLSKVDPNFHSGVARWSQHLSYNLQLGIVLVVVNVLFMALVVYIAHVVDEQHNDDEPFYETNWFPNELGINIIAILLMLILIVISPTVLANTHSKHHNSIGIIDTHISTQVIKDYKVESYKVHVETPFKQWKSGKPEYITKIYKNTANNRSWCPKYKEIKTLKFDNYFDASHLNLKRFDQ